MSFLTFNSSKSLEDFFKRKINPKVEDRIEYHVMEKFPKSRVLFTAEHAVSTKVPMKDFGKNAFVYVGDKNTGVLAKLAAYYSRAGYIIPMFSRIDADPARPVEDLGKGLRLFVKVVNEPLDEPPKLTHILIHKNISYKKNLVKYHEIIEKLKPKVIISIHGMHKTREFDALLGFGDNYEGIKNKDMALKFKNEFIAFLDEVAKDKIKKYLKIGIGVKRFAGVFTPVLNKHVIEHNRRTKDNRIGIQVELNWRGRVSVTDPAMPTVEYQILLQALTEFINKKWIKSSEK